MALIADDGSEAKQALSTVGGIASYLIADEVLRESPFVVAGCGPRLRIYCTYGDDAVTGDGANEDGLSWNPTENDWSMWLPVPGDDIAWIKTELAQSGDRILAYVAGEDEPAKDSTPVRAQLEINEVVFRKL